MVFPPTSNPTAPAPNDKAEVKVSESEITKPLSKETAETIEELLSFRIDCASTKAKREQAQFVF